MRMIRTSGLTSSSAPCSRAAINCMFLVCRDRTTPLPRTFAMPARRPQARALTPAREVEHRHLHRRLQRRPQLQLLQCSDPRQRRGLVRLRLLVPSTDDVILRCPGDAGAVRTPGAYRFVSSNSGVVWRDQHSTNWFGSARSKTACVPIFATTRPTPERPIHLIQL